MSSHYDRSCSYCGKPVAVGAGLTDVTRKGVERVFHSDVCYGKAIQQQDSIERAERTEAQRHHADNMEAVARLSEDEYEGRR